MSIGDELFKIAVRGIGRGIVQSISSQLGEYKAQKAAEREQAIEEAKQTLVCLACKTHLGASPKICHQCGSLAFITLYELQQALERQHQEEQSRQVELRKLKQLQAAEEKRLRARHQEYESRREVLTSSKLCVGCNLFYDADFNFCPSCCNATVPMPLELAQAVLAEEFPDLYEDTPSDQ